MIIDIYSSDNLSQVLCGTAAGLSCEGFKKTVFSLELLADWLSSSFINSPMWRRLKP
jgi:hypothetical protein